MKILLTGATGLVGKELGKALARDGHQLWAISRDIKKDRIQIPYPVELIEGELSKGPIQDPRLATMDAVVNLMGEPIAEGRWTEEKKKRLVESRVKGTENLVRSLGRPKFFVSASAIGIFGDRADETLTEESAASTDFLGDLCVQWEQAALGAQALGAKVTCTRFGMILSERGGALPQWAAPFRAGVGGPLGSGQQWVSWVHLDDVVGLIRHALAGQIDGPVNLVSPHPVRNIEFTRVMAGLLKKPGFWPVPKTALQALFGEKSVVMLGSQRVSSAKALASGYRFIHRELPEALRCCMDAWMRGEELFIAEQWLPHPPEKLFPFFSDIHNLEKITPDTLNFQVLGMNSEQIRQGSIIEYKLKLHGWPIKWKTQIEDWNPPVEFVDVQKKGPYELWHHRHSFEALAGGTLLVDQVRYRLPLGFVGGLAAGPWVRKDVAKIFDYRRQVIATEFSSPRRPPASAADSAPKGP